MQTGDKYEIDITDLSTDGKGIGRADGIVTFVPGLVPGDRASVEIRRVKKHIAEGEVDEILETSPHRTEPLCRFYQKCGGCAMQSLDYSYQLQWKNGQVKKQLQRLYGGPLPEFDEPSGMPDPWRYRNKTEFALSAGRIAEDKKTGKTRNTGKLKIGYYDRGSKRVVDIRECLIQSEAAEMASYGLRRYIQESGMTIYDPATGRGKLRRMIVRTGFSSGEVMVILVINGKKLKNPELLAEIMDEAVTGSGEFELCSIVVEYNTNKNMAVPGKQEVIAGSRTIRDHAAGMDLEISPQSFYQVNPQMMDTLYSTVLEYAGLQGGEKIFDLYCGAGTIGLYCASQADYVWGIESVEQAVLDANRNAVLNGAVNIQFLHGKAEERIDELLQKAGRPDLVILDPPRAGCRPELLETVLRTAPEKIIYVSCDPSTQARDLRILASEDSGYQVSRIRVIDQFCHTMHVETVCLLGRRKPDDTIKVSVNMDDYYQIRDAEEAEKNPS